MNDTVWVAIYKHRHGTDVQVFKSEKGAYAWRTRIAKEWWQVEFPNAPMPTDDVIGEGYFEALADRCDAEDFEVFQSAVL